MGNISIEQVIATARFVSFGPMLVIAFLVGLFFFWKKANEEYYDQNAVFDAVITSAFAALLGSRLGFILLNFHQFGFDLLKWFSVFALPGYFGVAGLLAGALTLHGISRKNKWDVYEVFDFGLIAISVSLFILNLAFFINGSGFGKPTTLPIGISFPGVFDKRHPVQLYASFLYLLLSIILYRLELIYRTFLWYRSNKRSAQPGFVTSVFLMLFGVIGFVLWPFQLPTIANYWYADLVMYGVFFIWGVILLFVRSGKVTFSLKK